MGVLRTSNARPVQREIFHTTREHVSVCTHDTEGEAGARGVTLPWGHAEVGTAVLPRCVCVCVSHMHLGGGEPYHALVIAGSSGAPVVVRIGQARAKHRCDPWMACSMRTQRKYAGSS